MARLRALPDDPVLPDAPAAIAGPRRGPYRPHTDATVAAVRRLIEQTTLTYREIPASGIVSPSISAVFIDGDWIIYYEPRKVTDTRGYFAMAKSSGSFPIP